MKNSPDKIERMKEVLADSYPKPAGNDRQALPAAARQLLKKSSPEILADESRSLWQRLREFLRGPQLIGLGAAAIVVIMATLHFAGDPATDTTDPSGPGFRSGAGDELPDMIVVMKALNEQQTDAIQNSGYFRKEQLVTLGVEGDLQEYKDHQVVLINGASGEITTPFSDPVSTQPMESDPDELASQVLDVLATFTTSEE